MVLNCKLIGMMRVKECFYVMCSKCGTNVSGSMFWDSGEEAASVWNRRAGDE